MRALLVLLVACGSSDSPAPPPAPTPAPPAAPTAPPAPPTTDEGRARFVIARLAAHDYPGAFDSFSASMRAALPADKLGEMWTSLEAKAGPFQQVDRVEVQAGSGANLVIAQSTFAHASLALKVGIDKRGKVSALFVAAGTPAWNPPPYDKPDAFTDTDVMVGKLPGTLSLPKQASHVPAVVLVHGSGPNDRDERLGGIAVFKDLAVGLASRGIAVLRYDKRSLVDPVGVHTQHDEVDVAAHAAVAFLRKRPEIDANRLALLGHSQGGYLAPRIATDDPAIKRLVLLAGETSALEDSILRQYRYFAKLHPGAQEPIDEVRAAEKLKATVEDPALRPDATVDVLGGSAPGAYFLDVRGYEPAEVAAKLTIPILVLQGERDYQVTPGDDYPAWKRALGGKPSVTFHMYPMLSHAFAPADLPPSPEDYAKPAHVDPQVIDDIAAFLSAP